MDKKAEAHEDMYTWPRGEKLESTSPVRFYHGLATAVMFMSAFEDATNPEVENTGKTTFTTDFARLSFLGNLF